MFYDYLIWGNWSPFFLWGLFSIAIVFYVLKKHEFGLENLTDRRFKWFLGFAFVFFIYYICIYDPILRPIQRFFLITIKRVPQISVGVGLSPILSIVLILFSVLVFYYIVKFVTRKTVSFLPKKSDVKE